jgi:hypothetical protein
MLNVNRQSLTGPAKTARPFALGSPGSALQIPQRKDVTCSSHPCWECNMGGRAENNTLPARTLGARNNYYYINEVS